MHSCTGLDYSVLIAFINVIHVAEHAMHFIPMTIFRNRKTIDTIKILLGLFCCISECILNGFGYDQLAKYGSDTCNIIVISFQ